MSAWRTTRRLFDDRLFWLALKNTFLFTGVTVVAEVVLGVAIALLINQTGIWTSRVTRLLILLPYAVPPIANGLIWSFIYSFQFGFLNRMLFSLGLIDAPINWSGNPDTAPCMRSLSRTSGARCRLPSLLVHAALQGIPRELHEAAAVDGATAWRRFWHLRCRYCGRSSPLFSSCAPRSRLRCSRKFWQSPRAVPGDATWVAAWYSYKTSFAPPNNFGVGSASAYVLALLIGLLAIVYVRFVYRRVTL